MVPGVNEERSQRRAGSVQQEQPELDSLWTVSSLSLHLSRSESPCPLNSQYDKILRDLFSKIFENTEGVLLSSWDSVVGGKKSVTNTKYESPFVLII